MVGSKISIVTPKAQTTRSRVTGVMVEGQSQLIFIDVPGVFGATQRFEKAMVAAAWNGAREADIVVFLFDARRLPNAETEQAMERLPHLDKPCLLALNKIDAVENKPTLLARVAWFNERMKWQEIFMISAKDASVSNMNHSRTATGILNLETRGSQREHIRHARVWGTHNSTLFKPQPDA